jgi:hypothetical protein
MLVSIEAIMGQLYPAVLVMRLVGMQVVYSMGQERTHSREPKNGP